MSPERDDLDGQMEFPWVRTAPAEHVPRSLPLGGDFAQCEQCFCQCLPWLLCWCCEIENQRAKVRDVAVMFAMGGIVLGLLLALLFWEIVG